MAEKGDIQARLRELPSTDEVLASAPVAAELSRLPRALVVDAARDAVESVRERILAGADFAPDAEAIALDAAARAVLAARPSLRRVINATGIIVHTNLGRSVLSEDAAAAVHEVATGYSTLEYDVESGERGSRHDHVEGLLTRLTGAEAALAVNNNAAAVVLALAALARGKQAVVSRGQLVEIGGSFRVPDVMAESGATMVDVGTTNKTHLSDYERAITPDTGLLLRVHTSNYRVVGFTDEVSLSELVALGAEHGIHVMEDQGSGVLIDLTRFGLRDEPTVSASVATGADVVTCSGDKLLGGPQAGIIVGKWHVISQLKKHPLARALRLDKMTLAALETTLRIYLDAEKAVAEIPTLRMLTAPAAAIGARAEALAARLRETCGDAAEVATQADVSRAGGGALPLADIATVVVTVSARAVSARALEERLRLGEPPIVARIAEDRLVLDPRTLLSAGEEDAVVARLAEAVLGGAR